MTDFVPELTMPEAEAAALRGALSRSNVYLEYGSGGSTVLAAAAPRRVFSVESDADWLSQMLDYFDANPPVAAVEMHHGDIGPTKAWGHPKSDENFRHWPDYPLSIWRKKGFMQPDLVLIDGRFRVACLLTVLFSCTAPTTVLFDDYVERTSYHAVEQIVKPTAFYGRMAAFSLLPTQIPPARLGWIISRFHQTA